LVENGSGLVEILKTIDDGVDFKLRLADLNEELKTLNKKALFIENQIQNNIINMINQ